MISVAFSYGASTLSHLFLGSPSDVKEYLKDSGKYALSSLVSFPPDPLPLIVLVSAIFTTMATIGSFLRGNFLVIREWVLLVGAWSGHHAMMKVLLREELKKVVNLLSEQLDRTAEQLNRWDKVAQEEEGKVEGLRDVSIEIGAMTKEFQGISETFSKMIALQRGISQEYVQLAHQMEEGRGHAIELLQEHKRKMEEIEKGVESRLALIQKHQETQLKNIQLMRELFAKIKEHALRNMKKPGEGHA